MVNVSRIRNFACPHNDKQESIRACDHSMALCYLEAANGFKRSMTFYRVCLAFNECSRIENITIGYRFIHRKPGAENY